MNNPIHTGEVRPSTTPPAGTPVLSPGHVVDALRRRSRDVIGPADCLLGPDCLVCRWRRAGLLDHPVVREPEPVYACRSSYCPGCNAVLCACPPDGYEDAVYEHDYALGFEHGITDGPQNRPTLRWLTGAGLDPDAYLDGYDAACASVSWPNEDAVQTTH